MWVGSAPSGSLKYRYADPTDPFVTGFNCGSSKYAREVNRYFRQVSWITSSPATTILQFGFADDPDVALAALRLSASDLIILVFGISTRWQGQRDPAPPNPAISQGVLQSIAQLAQGQGANRLTLRVREGNMKARTAYARAGFAGSRMIEHPSREATIELSKDIPCA